VQRPGRKPSPAAGAVATRIDRAAIADLLTAFVRKHAPWPPDSKSRFPADYPPDQLPHLLVRAPDVQAIMTVLGRRTPSPPHPAAWITLDLTRTDFRRAALNGANLQRARLRDVSLAKAWLLKADLRGVDLRGADLGGPCFVKRSPTSPLGGRCAVRSQGCRCQCASGPGERGSPELVPEKR
jgi:uncharacterized protein YjbI with pentapeptide repeats